MNTEEKKTKQTKKTKKKKTKASTLAKCNYWMKAGAWAKTYISITEICDQKMDVLPKKELLNICEWLKHKGNGSNDPCSVLIRLHVVELKLIFYIVFTIASIFIISFHICHATMVPFQSLSMLNEGREG